MSLRWILLTALTAFAVTLALVLGLRLSSDALALLLGVAVGIALSLPAQYFLFRLASRSANTPPVLTPTQTTTPTLPISPPNISLPMPRQFIFTEDEATPVPTAVTLD